MSFLETRSSVCVSSTNPLELSASSESCVETEGIKSGSRRCSVALVVLVADVVACSKLAQHDSVPLSCLESSFNIETSALNVVGMEGSRSQGQVTSSSEIGLGSPLGQPGQPSNKELAQGDRSAFVELKC